MDRKRFFDAIRKSLFGGKLKQGQVDGIQQILQEAGRRNLDRNSTAYILATVHWEAAKTFRPDIREFGRGKGRKYGKPAGPFGHVYYGRAWPQLTWLENYAKQANKLGLDLVANPDLVLNLEVSAKVTFGGMIDGDFTGRRLSQYVGPRGGDFVEARRVVNGTDRAHTIAEIADKYLAALVAAGWGDVTAPVPAPRPQSRMHPDKAKDAAGPATSTVGGERTITAPDPAADPSGLSWQLWGGVALLLIGLAYTAWRFRHPISVQLALWWDGLKSAADKL